MIVWQVSIIILWLQPSCSLITKYGLIFHSTLKIAETVEKIWRCHQWSTRPDTQSRLQRSLLSLILFCDFGDGRTDVMCESGAAEWINYLALLDISNSKLSCQPSNLKKNLQYFDDLRGNLTVGRRTITAFVVPWQVSNVGHQCPL